MRLGYRINKMKVRMHNFIRGRRSEIKDYMTLSSNYVPREWKQKFPHLQEIDRAGLMPNQLSVREQIYHTKKAMHDLRNEFYSSYGSQWGRLSGEQLFRLCTLKKQLAELKAAYQALHPEIQMHSISKSRVKINHSVEPDGSYTVHFRKP